MNAAAAAKATPAVRTIGGVGGAAVAAVAEPGRGRGRLVRWAYPFAAAALLVIGVVIYNRGNRPTENQGETNTMPSVVGDNAQYARLPNIIPESDLAPLEEEGLSLRTQGGSGFFSESIDAGDLDR
jgi:hypothetical protein